MSGCDYVLVGICLTHTPPDTGFAIFGFAEFLAALALLVVVFNTSDFLYRFRTSIAPVPLLALSFGATVVIGVGTLLTDLWFAEGWYSLPWGWSRASLQGIFGAMFLATVLLWIWFAYIRPPVFGRWNGKRFYFTLYRSVVRGSDAHLSVLAAELVASAEALVRLSRGSRKTAQSAKPEIADYAHDALLMLGNRKICRHIVASSPVTVIALMEEVSKQGRYMIPLGGFAQNITCEALRNRDSIIYHEDSYGSDVLGWVQPFSKALYGDYRLVESMDSPLDIGWQLAADIDGEQFSAYCRITLLTFRNYIEGGWYLQHSYSLYRAFGTIKAAGRYLHKLNNNSELDMKNAAVERLSSAVRFVSDAIEIMEKKEDIFIGCLRVSDGGHGLGSTIFDQIADMMFELLLSSASIRSPIDHAWAIQHNSVWGRFFTYRDNSKVWNAIRFKLSRMIFDEIKQLEDFPNYKGARILGVCLNVMGLTLPTATSRDRGEHRIHKAVIGWTKKNYMNLQKIHPPVAAYCLNGGISFDLAKSQLIKTYLPGLSLEPSRSYLDLDPPR